MKLLFYIFLLIGFCLLTNSCKKSKNKPRLQSSNFASTYSDSDLEKEDFFDETNIYYLTKNFSYFSSDDWNNLKQELINGTVASNDFKVLISRLKSYSYEQVPIDIANTIIDIGTNCPNQGYSHKLTMIGTVCLYPNDLKTANTIILNLLNSMSKTSFDQLDFLNCINIFVTQNAITRNYKYIEDELGKISKLMSSNEEIINNIAWFTIFMYFDDHSNLEDVKIGFKKFEEVLSNNSFSDDFKSKTEELYKIYKNKFSNEDLE